MRWLFDVAYLAALALFSPVILYRAWRRQKYRQGWSQKLWGRAPRLPTASSPRIWLHAVSMGEVHLLEPLVREISRRHPEWECVISTTTKSGWEAAERKFASLTRFYCPLDFSWAVKQAMQRIQPDLLVLSELELWPNLIDQAKRHGARVAVVNGRLSENSLRGYSKLSWLIAPLLGKLDCVAAQNNDYANRFRQLGAAAESTHVTGSMKFDGAVTNRDNPESQRLRRLSRIPKESFVLLAGSTQDPEERLAIRSFQALAREFPQLHLLLAPRHPERFEAVAALLSAEGVAFQRRTQMSETECGSPSRVVLIDSMGELRAWWGLSDVAYVGGSMGSRGGQNMIEPAAYGAAVCFGPKTSNFQDVVRLLLAHEAAEVVEDGEQLTDFARRCLVDPACAQRMGRNAQQVVSEQLGAAGRTLDLLEPLIRQNQAIPVAA